MGCCNPKDDNGKELPIIIDRETKSKNEADNSVLISSHSCMQEPTYNVKYRPRKEKGSNISNGLSTSSLQNRI
jgi:hypothetical protein